jgi:PAS domain S-box-containing protein
MPEGLKLSHKMLILVAVPLLFNFAFMLALNQLLEQAEKERQNEYIARSIIQHVNEVHRVLLDNATAGAALSMTLSPEKRAERARTVRLKMEKEERILTKMLSDKPVAREHFERAQKIMKDGAEQLKLLKRMFRHEGLLATKDKAAEIFGTLSDKLNEILVEERQAEALSPKVQAEQREKIQAVLLMGVVLNMVIAIGMVLFLIREITGRMSILMDNTVRLARGMPLNPPLKGNDEFTHLDRVFNEMAGALEAASARERAITESVREAEARTRNILQSLPLGLVIVDLDGVVEYANYVVMEMFVLKPTNFIGQPFDQIVSERIIDTKQPGDLIERALEHHVECSLKTDTRSELPLEISFRRIETIDGERLLGLIIDVTERHEIERLKQEFVSMVSHDLRTPLTSVQSYLELLADGIYGKLNEPGLERLASLGESIDRLVKLICDLLDLDRLESGNMHLRKSMQNLQAMVEQTLSACMAQREEKNVSVVAPKTSLKVNLDGDRVVQVLVNLVSNAIKFSPQDGVVNLSIEERDGVVEFRVQDQGCGIAPEYQKTIFDRFKQAPEGEENRKGTGLGLAISKAIVEQHGGQIGVTSEAGKGSTFWFTIPV